MFEIPNEDRHWEWLRELEEAELWTDFYEDEDDILGILEDLADELDSE